MEEIYKKDGRKWLRIASLWNEQKYKRSDHNRQDEAKQRLPTQKVQFAIKRIVQLNDPEDDY